MSRCALYLRSSKDRHDVSIDAQRRELVALARSKGLAIAAEFSDVVASGSNENRPGWQALLGELKSPARSWRAVLALDTARIARNQWIAHGLRHECKKRGVDLIFAKTPELDGIAGVILPAVLHAMDEVHSMLSREKGLAGMAENVRRGFRAGGSAPLGYRLERIATGSVRDGEPVTKSKLEPDAKAPAIARYLKARAEGKPRGPLARELGLAKTSLLGIEWNALTYAGHTVWNASSRRDAHGYQGKTKRRPREEWIVQRGTHAPLITDEEAERILARLQARKQTRLKGAAYLLSGILVAPGGRRWHGDGQGYYRCGGRAVKAETLERAVLGKLAGDLTSERFVKTCLARSREQARPRRLEAELRAVQREALELERKAARIRNVIAEMKHPEGMIRTLDQVEARRLELDKRAGAMAEQLAGERVITMISEEHVRQMLRVLADGLAAGDEAEREDLKIQIRDLLEEITLDPDGLNCQLHYAIPVIAGDKLASPWGADLIPSNFARLRARARLALLAGSRRRMPRAA